VTATRLPQSFAEHFKQTTYPSASFTYSEESYLNRKTTSITQRVTIPALPKEVYEALIDPKKHSAFTGSPATGSAKVGAKFTAWDGYISGKNLELERGKRIVQEWVTTDWPRNLPPSRLELTFKEVDGKTELTMIHSDIPVDQKEELEQGRTDYYWNPMKNYFEAGKRGASR